MLSIKQKYIEFKNRILGSQTAVRTMQNSGWLVANRMFSLMIGVFVMAMVARYFGPEKNGQFNYALSFVMLFTVLSTLGLDTLTVKAIVDKQYDEGTVLCTSLYLRVAGGIILIVLSTLGIHIFEPNDHELNKMVFILSLMMVFKSLEVIEYWIAAYQKAKVSSLIRITAYIVNAGLKLAVVVFKGNLIHFSLIYAVDALIIGVALIVIYFRIREDHSKWRFDFGFAKEILSKSWYLILSGLMVTLYMRIDQVMLGAIMPSKEELGIYSAAAYIASLWYFVPTAVIDSFKPVILRNKKTDEKSYLKSLQVLYTIVTWICVGFGIIILLFSNLIVNILYGEEYMKAASILSVSVWAGTFALMGSARSIWEVSEGLQKYSVVFVFVGAVVNVVLNSVLIPPLGGFGAAIATLACQISVALIAPLFFRRTRISTFMLISAFKFDGLIEKKNSNSQ